MLVQGAGGNTSEKVQGDRASVVMWIKASGAWLAEAEQSEMFVAVDVKMAQAAMAAGNERVPAEAQVDGAEGLRPSIETSLHLALPQRCVAHYHSVNGIAWATRVDGEARLGELLEGIEWCWVPYARPGLPLCEALGRRVSLERPPRLVVLANHGLVAAGDSWDEVETLVQEVERRLNRPTSFAVQKTLRPPAPQGWTWLDFPQMDGLARDPIARERAAKASYYPDHVIFLGHAAWVGELSELAEVADRDNARLAIIPDVGCLLSDTAKAGASAMAQTLADFLLRVPAEADLNGLSHDDEGALLGWEAEAYRQKLAALRAQ